MKSRTIAALRRPAFRTTVVLAGAAALFGCGASPEPNSPSAVTKATASSPKPLPGVPRIVGTVLSTAGNPPVAPKGGGVVYLEDAPKERGVATTAEIDIHNKEFTPFIAVVAAGGTVTFGNKDALTHHVFSPDLDKWDTGYLRKNETSTRQFDTPGAIALLCNIHPEMLGYLLVIPSSYYGKLGDDGQYAIVDVPAGTYRLTAWAPRMQPMTQSVTVGASGKVRADFQLHPAGAPR